MSKRTRTRPGRSNPTTERRRRQWRHRRRRLIRIIAQLPRFIEELVEERLSAPVPTHSTTSQCKQLAERLLGFEVFHAFVEDGTLHAVIKEPTMPYIEMEFEVAPTE